MAAGDIKGEEAVIEYVTAGAVVTKGQLVHLEPDDNKWDPAVTDDYGPWGVAHAAAAADGATFPVVTYGRVEIKYGGTDDALVGAVLRPATQAISATSDGAIGDVTEAGGDCSGNKVCGTASELMDTSGNTYTMFIGRGGA